ncbi:hypothetical protein AJ78_03893 [Emergomyces pasteurianus Ep9510]|uniref:Uncharacterized protein n=1 Tax=Emergomyces pasteurianus Ep9510 TaxID=1447872 RepID=A0A1J9Q6L8_9EURO|nr:hypothetical protein AJ78_03893 [Emergomyces pasteurianus Ep9510]
MKFIYSLTAGLIALATTVAAAPQLPLDTVTGVVGGLPVVGGLIGGLQVKSRRAPGDGDDDTESE